MYNEDYKAKFALVAYNDGEGINNFYLELHNFEDGRFKAGKPLMDKDLLSFGQSLLQGAGTTYLAHTGLMPSNVLQLNQTQKSVTWFVPSQIRWLSFQYGSSVFAGACIQPHLVFKTTRGALAVYGVHTDKIEIDTPLFQAPYPNTGTTVCMGGAIRPDELTDLQSYMEGFEKAFFNSVFTHGGQIQGRNIAEFWKDLIDTKADKFPNEVMREEYSLETINEIL